MEGCLKGKREPYIWLVNDVRRGNGRAAYEGDTELKSGQEIRHHHHYTLTRSVKFK